ncbi:MAG TPA: hypothetical protein VI756_19950 [Blastocatellia bacterium]
MKRIVSLIAMISLMSVAYVAPNGKTLAQAPTHAGGSADQTDFQRYDGSYFARNDSGLKGKSSYLVLTTQAQFDAIFHPAATMGHNTFLPDKTFDTKMVVAAIYRADYLRKYDVTKVTAKGTALYVSYTFKDDSPGSARFNSPLILTVDRNHYSRVVFVANGKVARVVRVAPA